MKELKKKCCSGKTGSRSDGKTAEKICWDCNKPILNESLVSTPHQEILDLEETKRKIDIETGYRAGFLAGQKAMVEQVREKIEAMRKLNPYESDNRPLGETRQLEGYNNALSDVVLSL